MPVAIHPRYASRPIGFTVPLSDPTLHEFDPTPDTADFPTTWAAELVCRSVEILAGSRGAPAVHRSIHPRLLSSLRRAHGRRAALVGPRLVTVRFQREVAVVRLAGVVRCGEAFHAVTAEWRRNASGRYWMTHFGVL